MTNTHAPLGRTGALPLAVMLCALPVGGVALWGCDDPFAALLLDVPETPTEIVLSDFFTAPIEDAAALDLITELPAQIEFGPNWDFVFRVEAGRAELATFTAVTDSTNDAGFFETDLAFDEIEEAPDEGYNLVDPVAVVPGKAVIVRSRRNPSTIVSCSYYAKIEVLMVDLEAGTVKLQFLRNPNCGDTVLIPGQHGSL